MLWIKRNLFFVLSMVVGVGLIAWAAYDNFSISGKNSAASGDLTENRDKLANLKNEVPPPTSENIQAARDEAKEVEAILAQFRTVFAPFPPPPKADEKEFKQILETTIEDLRRQASNATVDLPFNYAFTFSSQMEKLTYLPESIEPWLAQMDEIRAICAILFEARIAALDTIQRVPVSSDDEGAQDYLPGVTSLTNQLGVWTPYKITFRAYSEQIGDVLEGFAKSKRCWVVKDVDVRQSMQSLPVIMPQEVEQPPPQMQQQFSRPRMDPRMDPRFSQGMDGGGPRGHMRGGDSSMMNRFRPMAPQQFMPPPQAAAGPVTILSPKLLFVTLSVDLVKLKPPEVPTNKPAIRPNPRSARPTAAAPTPTP